MECIEVAVQRNKWGCHHVDRGKASPPPAPLASPSSSLLGAVCPLRTQNFPIFTPQYPPPFCPLLFLLSPASYPHLSSCPYLPPPVYSVRLLNVQLEKVKELALGAEIWLVY